jgi:hypothetical protein
LGDSPAFESRPLHACLIQIDLLPFHRAQVDLAYLENSLVNIENVCAIDSALKSLL